MRVISDEKRRALVEAFRKLPPDAKRPGRAYRSAARAAGIDHRTAASHWLHGGPGQEAISAIVERERARARGVLARGELQQKFIETMAAAVDDAAQGRAGEALAARAAVTTAGGLLAQLNSIAPLVERHVVLATKAILTDEAEPRVRIAFVQRLLNVGKQLTEMLGQAQQIERRAVGEPDTIVGVMPLAGGPPPTDEELSAEAEAVQRAVASLKSAKSGEDGDGAGIH